MPFSIWEGGRAALIRRVSGVGMKARGSERSRKGALSSIQGRDQVLAACTFGSALQSVTGTDSPKPKLRPSPKLIDLDRISVLRKVEANSAGH